MDDNSIKSKIDSLRAEIARHEKLYRIHNAPVISDDDFDSLMRELRELEALYPQYYDPNSPSLTVGNDLSGDFKSVRHLSPMLSLDNVFNSAELEEFDARLKKALAVEARLRYCVEPKIDGCGISAVYENGKLIRLLTRGKIDGFRFHIADDRVVVFDLERQRPAAEGTDRKAEHNEGGARQHHVDGKAEYCAVQAKRLAHIDLKQRRRSLTIVFQHI